VAHGNGIIVNTESEVNRVAFRLPETKTYKIKNSSFIKHILQGFVLLSYILAVDRLNLQVQDQTET